MTTSKTLEEIADQWSDEYWSDRVNNSVVNSIKSACLEYSKEQAEKIAELQTKLTETNERLMARELLLTQQHDDLVKLEDRVKELESIAAFARHRTDCLFYKEMPCNCGLKSAQQPKEHHEGT